LTKSIDNDQTFWPYNSKYIVQLNTILLADDYIISSESEDALQRAINKLENAANGFNMRISTMKTKTMAFKGKQTM
jgi:hypothetical protein